MNTHSPSRDTRPAFYTIKEAAYALGVSERTVRSLISHGELKARKFRGCVRIPFEAIENAGKPMKAVYVA